MSYSELNKHQGRAWRPRSSNGMGPGVVRLNDANLLMLPVIAQGVEPAKAKAMAQAVRALHQATQRGWSQTQKAAGRVRDLAIELRGRMPKQLETAAMQRMLAGVMRDGVRGQHRDYAGAEQGFLALDSLLTSLDAVGAISSVQNDRMRVAMDKVYLTLRTHEKGYRPSK